MIKNIDKAIINILLKVVQMLTNYSDKITTYDIYVITQMVKEIGCEESGDKG